MHQKIVADMWPSQPISKIATVTKDQKIEGSPGQVGK